jgi:hypothetical protein
MPERALRKWGLLRVPGWKSLGSMYFPKFTVLASSLGRFQMEAVSFWAIPREAETAGN